jgi:hypothetical protein
LTSSLESATGRTDELCWQMESSVGFLCDALVDYWIQRYGCLKFTFHL